MHNAINGILQSYGVRIELKREKENTVFRAFFQPVRSKSWQYLEGNYSPLGEVPRGQFVYMGPADLELLVGDTLCVGEKDYMLRRVEPVYYRNKIAYRWGICVEKGGEDTWGQS